MIIPCIDLMGGSVVQLVQGKEKALERTVEQALAMFEGFPLLHVIDLDAAMGSGNNGEIVTGLLKRCNARVGGGVRTVAKARSLVDAGAHQVIVGSAAYSRTGVDAVFLTELVREIGCSRIMVAIDTRGGNVVIDGWKTVLKQKPSDVIGNLEPYCGGYLCTNVDREGLLQGTDLEHFLALRDATSKPLVAAGGITSMSEVYELTSAGIEVALGMALYTGRLSIVEVRELLSKIEFQAE